MNSKSAHRRTKSHKLWCFLSLVKALQRFAWIL